MTAAGWEEDGRIPVAVLGATGIVGQHIIRRLEEHSVFRLAEVAASSGRAGARYGASVRWIVSDAPPENAAELELSDPGGALRSPIVLSALPAAVAREVEPVLARAGHVVCTNSSVHRMDASVPLIVPEVNGDQLSLVSGQPWADGGGALVANPNCVVTGLALALDPIQRNLGIRSGVIVTLQALSGAGVDGPTALSQSGNVVPWIEGEEEKIGPELGKVLGSAAPFSVAVNRVPVLDGHTAHVFLHLETETSIDRVEELLRQYGPDDVVAGLHSIPDSPLRIRRERDRPQPRLDAWAGDGMTVSVGRVRSVDAHDVALVVVSHNAVRGAAGACLANAELCVVRGLLPAAVV